MKPVVPGSFARRSESRSHIAHCQAPIRLRVADSLEPRMTDLARPAPDPSTTRAARAPRRQKRRNTLHDRFCGDSSEVSRRLNTQDLAGYSGVARMWIARRRAMFQALQDPGGDLFAIDRLGRRTADQRHRSGVISIMVAGHNIAA